MTEHRFRNAFIRNIYGEIIQLDINHNEESIDGAPRIALDLNNSNINNIHSIYIKKDSNSTVNNSTINWHNNTDNKGTIDTLVSGDGSLSFISKRTINNSLSNSEVISNPIDVSIENTKRLFKIDVDGNIHVKRNINAFGNLTIGKVNHKFDDATDVITDSESTIYGSFTVYPTKDSTDDYLKVNVNDGNMEVSSSGTITGANKAGNWIHTFVSSTAFYVPPVPLTSTGAQGVLSWRTSQGDGYCINNLGGENKTRLQYATKANIDSGTNSSSDVFTIENGVMNINGTVTDATRLISIGAEINPHTNRTTLEYSQGSGITGTPSTDWHSYITMLHANTNGYFTQLASSFHSDDLYWRRKSNGSGENLWHKIPFTDSNFTFTGIVNVPTPPLP